MSISVNGTNITGVYVNGVEMDVVNVNGVEVYRKQIPWTYPSCTVTAGNNTVFGTSRYGAPGSLTVKTWNNGTLIPLLRFECQPSYGHVIGRIYDSGGQYFRYYSGSVGTQIVYNTTHKCIPVVADGSTYRNYIDMFGQIQNFYIQWGYGTSGGSLPTLQSTGAQRLWFTSNTWKGFLYESGTSGYWPAPDYGSYYLGCSFPDYESICANIASQGFVGTLEVYMWMSSIGVLGQNI